MPNGSSRWNGNYGDEEKARRAAYGKITHVKEAGKAEALSDYQGRKALVISDEVPRDVVKPIPPAAVR